MDFLHKKNKKRFALKSTVTANLCSKLGIIFSSLINEGLSLRATFIINPDGILKFYEIHDNSIGRNVNEIIRKLKAAQYVSKHKGEICPVNWDEGKETLKPGLNLVGKI